MSETEELAKLIDGAYKNILERFNPCARQLIAAGKAYLKALHGAVAASKAYIDTLSKLARYAHQGTWGGCTDIGTALMQLVDVQKEIQAQQLNILKAFYVDLLVPLESNIDKDTKVVTCEQKKFLQQHKCLQESFLKAASIVKKQKKKNRAGRTNNLDKEIKNIQVLEEEKMKLDCFCERSLKQAITQERRRYGFVLERQCSLTKHHLVYHTQGQFLLQHRLEEWEEVAKSRETLPEPIDKLFSPSNDVKAFGEYASSNILTGLVSSQAGVLRKTRSIEASCLDLRDGTNDLSPRPLTRAKSDFNIASSSASLASNEYGIALRPKSLVDCDGKRSRRKVRALYSYLSSGEHQLSFHEGDIIVLIGEKNKGWQYGENQRNNRCGWFPFAYTELLDDSGTAENDIDISSVESKRHSSDLFPTYSSSGVSHSRTIPNIHPHTSAVSGGYMSNILDTLPPVPTVRRPLSTFVESCSPRSLECFQRLRNGECTSKVSHSSSSASTSICSTPAPTPTSPTGPTITSDCLRLPRLPVGATSHHSSNDSGFCNDGPAGGTSAQQSLGEVGEKEKPRENMFASVKLRKVVTNDRSAPMIT